MRLLLVERNKLDKQGREVLGRQFRLPASDEESKASVMEAPTSHIVGYVLPDHNENVEVTRDTSNIIGQKKIKYFRTQQWRKTVKERGLPTPLRTELSHQRRHRHQNRRSRIQLKAAGIPGRLPVAHLLMITDRHLRCALFAAKPAVNAPVHDSTLRSQGLELLLPVWKEV